MGISGTLEEEKEFSVQVTSAVFLQIGLLAGPPKVLRGIGR